ncbi:hypothetical protein CPT_P15_015 [Pectobacterium phage vB_PcaP_P15_PC2B6]|uniref:Uncharacterized protein n=1 Tax=Pectobacterium phage vB_PcaP_P15_PC2B6 TaxID=2968434 RepID=A0AAX3BQ96_9CAUD|nr:hypothetical protein CPT_P15_015 [Pectobacterium phage vB_PcaP_P15_PC2B6]
MPNQQVTDPARWCRDQYEAAIERDDPKAANDYMQLHSIWLSLIKETNRVRTKA